MFLLGPAHAVYFGTYEAVKQKLGGNVGSEHHPFAVGMASIIFPVVLCVNFWFDSHGRSLCYNC